MLVIVLCMSLDAKLIFYCISQMKTCDRKTNSINYLLNCFFFFLLFVAVCLLCEQRVHAKYNVVIFILNQGNSEPFYFVSIHFDFFILSMANFWLALVLHTSDATTYSRIQPKIKKKKKKNFLRVTIIW